MASLHVLVASASPYRRWWYAEELRPFGIEVATAAGGLDCLVQMRTWQPDVILLETSLLWGGTLGVLAVRSEEPPLQNIPVVLMAGDRVSSDWYQFAGYPVQGLVLRNPSGQQLAETLLAASCEARTLPAILIVIASVS